MFKKLLLLMLFALGLNFTTNAQINCDSVKREFNNQIAELKKQGTSAEIIKSIENSRDMMLKLYCPDAKNAQATAKNSGAKSQNTNAGLTKGGKTSLNLNTSHEITMNIVTMDEGLKSKVGLTYYLADNGESIFIPSNGFTGKGMVPEQMEGTFDGWHIPFNGTQKMFATNPEMGKLAYSMPSEKKLMINQNPKNLKVQKTGAKKSIAGYPCDGYKVTGSQNNQNFSFNCFVSTNGLPFQQRGYAGLSMIPASVLGIAGSERRGVLEITGKSGADDVSMTVTAIKPLVKKIHLSGYTMFGAAAY